MDNQKLNEKLAKWAGFRQLPVGKSGFHWERCQRVGNWMPPEETDTWQSRDHLPNFTDSLDACFKWLVPKLYPSKLDKLGLEALVNNAICDSIENKCSVALALCLAIEKLIDGG